jgi:4-amino-4-deoxy-L-arabinose transferase-like glycosyltransferase
LFFSYDGINADTNRTPGYPLLLALFYALGGDNSVVVIAQVILVAVKLFVVYQILKLLGVSFRLAFLSLFLIVISLTSFELQFTILTEAFFGSLIIFSFYFFVKFVKFGARFYDFAIFSALFNYAILVRPILIYFGLLLCVALLIAAALKKIKLSIFFIFFIAYLLCCGGWIARNYVQTGVAKYCTNAAGDQYFAWILEYDSTSVNDPRAVVRDLFNEKYPSETIDDLNPAQRAVLLGSVAKEYISARPIAYIAKCFTGLFREMFGPTEVAGRLVGFSLSKPIGFIGFIYIFYLCGVYALYFAGVLAQKLKFDITQTYIFALSAYLLVASAAPGHARYRDPWWQLVIIGAIVSAPFIKKRFYELKNFIKIKCFQRAL